MKLNSKHLIHTPLLASDGQRLGKIKDLLFEDREWKIRYVVVDTGGWLTDRRVLVMPDQLLLTPKALEDGKVPSKLTKISIEGCPPLDVDAPVSRRYEAEHAAYYKATPYWLGSVVWGTGDSANLIPPSPAEEAEHQQALDEIERCHVRSTTEIEGYDVIAANDVGIGEVEHFEVKWDTGQIVTIVSKEGGLLTTKHERDLSPNTIKKIDYHTRRLILSIPYNKDGLDHQAQSLTPGKGLPAPSF